VHSIISNEPHLLSSRPERLLANKQLLQQLLGLEEADMHRIIVKARR
jgi:hypothetical protein